MRVNRQLKRLEPEEIGGRARASQDFASHRLVNGQDPVDGEENIDIYPASHPSTVAKRRHTTARRLKAKAVAEARLNRLSDELLELADELRELNPLMADALDTAWVAADEALEILLDDHMW
jgi:hypothetical protein